MAFLPPKLANEVTIGNYVLVGGCAVFVWDILDNLTNDYKLLTKYKIRPATVVYLISRLGSLGLVLCSTIYVTAGISADCPMFIRIVGGFYPVTIPATSLLFLFRVRAVFDNNRLVVAFFVIVWLALFGTAITIPFGLVGTRIGPTAYCLIADMKEFVVVPTVISFASDTLVLLAITWRLMTNAHVSPQGIRGVKGMVLGDYLPSFSRALLHGGQKYYTATVSLNLLTVIMLYLDSVPALYRLMFVIPNVALMNIMASRVYRDTKFGVLWDSSTPSSAHNDTTKIAGTLPIARFTREHNSTFEMTTDYQRRSPSDAIVVHIEKDVHYGSPQESVEKV